MDADARLQARVQRELQKTHALHLDEWLSAAEKAGVLLTEPVPQSRSQLASGVSVAWLSSLSKSLQDSQLNVPTTASVKQVLEHALHKHPACTMLDLVPQEHVSYASVYISHSWGNDFFSLVRVLEQDLELKWQAHLGFLDEKARSKGKSSAKENDARAVQDLLAEEARQAEADLVERRRQALLAGSNKPPAHNTSLGNASFGNGTSPCHRLSSQLPSGHPAPTSRLPSIAARQQHPTSTAASFPPAQHTQLAQHTQQAPPQQQSARRPNFAHTSGGTGSNRTLPSIRQRTVRRSSTYGGPDEDATRERPSKLSSLHSNHADMGSENTQRSATLTFAADEAWREAVELSPVTGLPRVSAAASRKSPLSVSMEDLESAKRRRPKQLAQQQRQQEQQQQPTSPLPTSPHPSQPIGPPSPPATPASPTPPSNPQLDDLQLQDLSWAPSSPCTPSPHARREHLQAFTTCYSNMAAGLGSRQGSLPAMLEGHAGFAAACAQGVQVRPSAVAAAPAGMGQFSGARLRSRGQYTDMEALRKQQRGKVPVIDPPARKSAREMLLRNQTERENLVNAHSGSEAEWREAQQEEEGQESQHEGGRIGGSRTGGSSEGGHSLVERHPEGEQGSPHVEQENQNLHQHQSPLQQQTEQQTQQTQQQEPEASPGGQPSQRTTERRLKGSVSWKPVLAVHKKEARPALGDHSRGSPQPPPPSERALPLGLSKKQAPRGEERSNKKKGKDKQGQDGAHTKDMHARADQGVKIQRAARRSSSSGSQLVLTPEQAKEAKLHSYKQQFVGYFVWLDVFALPLQQCEKQATAAVVNAGRLIGCIGRVCVILDQELKALTRSWILYEVWMALKHRRSVYTLSTSLPAVRTQGDSMFPSFKTTGTSQQSAGPDALPESLDLLGSEAGSEKQRSAIRSEFSAEVDSPKNDIFSLDTVAAHIREGLESARVLELRRDTLVQSLYMGLSRCCFTYQFEEGTPPAQKQLHATIAPFLAFAEGRFKQEMLHDSALRVTHGHDPEFYLWKLLVFLQQQLTAARSEPVWITLLGKYAAIAERSFSARFSNGVVNEMMGAVGGVFDVNLLRQYCKSVCSSQRTATHTSIMETSSESADSDEDENGRGFRDSLESTLSLRELE